jgi:hypothetical protein
VKPITGRITLVEFCPNREDGFTRFGIADHPAPHVILLGHEATITVEGRAASFQELMAWVSRRNGVSVGTFYPDPQKYCAATRADFVSQ